SLADAKSKKKSGKDKHGAIEEQLEMNTAAIDEIQQAIAASIDPILLAVDCTNGDSISAELARLATAPNHIQINITGVCEEQVLILRNNVTLSGSGPQDGITGNYAVAATHGVSNVTVRDMTLKGGFAGLTCHQGAAVTGVNLHILDGERGVLAFHNGTCRLIDSLISGNTQGMTIALAAISGALGYFLMALLDLLKRLLKRMTLASKPPLEAQFLLILTQMC
ncbi:MAG: hypothetical protein ACKVKR_07405, partial [Pseudomonadales bacterium]